MKKIYISPSMQKYNAYAAGNTTEAEQCHRIGEYAAAALKRCGFDVKLAAASQTAEQNVAESNAWGADYHVCIHTNAASGKGRDVVVFTSAKNINDACAKGVYAAIDALDSHVSVYGIREENFYEIKATTAKCIYIEAEFHDVVSLAAWIIDNVERIGEAIAQGFCTGAGVKYIPKMAIRFKTIEDIPAGYRKEAQELIDAGSLKGKNSEQGLDVTEDMLRCMIINHREAKSINERLDKLADDVTDKIVGKILAGLNKEDEA